MVSDSATSVVTVPAASYGISSERACSRNTRITAIVISTLVYIAGVAMFMAGLLIDKDSQFFSREVRAGLVIGGIPTFFIGLLALSIAARLGQPINGSVNNV